MSLWKNRGEEFKGKSLTPKSENQLVEEVIPAPQQQIQPVDEQKPVRMPYKEIARTESSTDIKGYEINASQALSLVDDVVLKNYLTRLSNLEIVSLDSDISLNDTIIFKVNKMVYEKDEYATDKFISIVSAMTYTKGSVFMIVDGHKDHTDFYLGVKCEDSERTASSVAETFTNAMIGQFPGAQISDLSIKRSGVDRSEQEHLIHKMTEATTISMCSGIPAQKNSKGEYTNATFIQGIEKFAIAMQGKEYTAVILASSISQDKVTDIRFQYETISSALSIYESQQLNLTSNESLSSSISNTIGESITHGLSHTEGTSSSHTHTTSHTTGSSDSHTSGISDTKGRNRSGGISFILSANAGTSKSKTKSESDTHSTNQSDTSSDSFTRGNSQSDTTSETKAKSTSKTSSETNTQGTSRSLTVNVKDKHIQEILKKIDKQLERISVCESSGLWAANAYFLSYETDRAIAETGATIFRSIIQGEQSGVEFSAINTWYNDNPAYLSLSKYVCGLTHPQFVYHNSISEQSMVLTPTTMLSSKEVAIMMGLPRKSVPGFPVVEHITLGKEVVRLSNYENRKSFELGCIFDQGIDMPNNKVHLDVKSLTQHVFVTGSTGCGKSETVYKLIDSVRKANTKFLIIEPAKGEYKNVFGTEHIFGTNPLISNLLRINPFRFTKGVHVLEHADRLIEIFNVCWPMYAAMPAVLKEAVLNSYEDCGWDLIKSKNKYSEEIFPTFSDLIWELETVIEASSYSEEVKSNYKGSLVTRVKSLANGINGEIFSGKEIGDDILFDENVIVDLSRIGSQETKALIMGVLIMRLNEYRANSGIEANSELRHVTILEEAHNILKRCSQEQSMEGSNVAGKSVEMISNAIAEMRTYGEGFIIVDQSPGAVDISAIRNTNTKIIMRLPEESDRKISGKSAAMKDNQIDEIAKLPTGVAVVYQNDWEEPVLCHINMYKGERLKYVFMEDVEEPTNEQPVIREILKFMMKEKVEQPQLDVKESISKIKNGISSTNLPTYVKLNIFAAIQEFEETGTASIWKNKEYEKFSWVISGVFGTKQEILKLTKQVRDFDELTDGLKKIINEKVESIPSELELSLCQSLMRDYSIGDENRLKIYNAWLQKTKKKLM
ncbi:ATP-binding protein [uncultured Bacteroides sp.]|uniref:ATP-binding protein n=1 Tax=uncultured Bacteroides sp. TaxID=162156 RepID=UPI00261910CA|nr:ATP-binding protein [uncultured Bacteroides sp.]